MADDKLDLRLLCYHRLEQTPDTRIYKLSSRMLFEGKNTQLNIQLMIQVHVAGRDPGLGSIGIGLMQVAQAIFQLMNPTVHNEGKHIYLLDKMIAPAHFTRLTTSIPTPPLSCCQYNA